MIAARTSRIATGLSTNLSRMAFQSILPAALTVQPKEA